MKYLVILGLISLLTITSLEHVSAIPMWQKDLDGTITSADISADGNHIVTGTKISDNEGKVHFFDVQGKVLWEENLERIIAGVSLSRDSSLVLVNGYQLSEGRGKFYMNPATYLFDQSGNILWKYENANQTSLGNENQFLTGIMTPQKNILIAFDYGLLYLDTDGNLLWNYTVPGRTSGMQISSDGSIIALGVNGHLDDTWWLYVFDNLGNLLWKYDGIDGLVQGGAVSLSSNGEQIVIGSMASGEYGNLYLFDINGNLLWTRNVDGGILSTDMSDNGSFTVVESNYGTTVFDEFGNNIDTKPTFHTVLSSDDSLIITATPIENYYNLTFFDTRLVPIQTEEIQSELRTIVSNGEKTAVGTQHSTDLGQYNQLYLFEKNTKVNYVDFRDADGEIIEKGCIVALRGSIVDNFGDQFSYMMRCHPVTIFVIFLISSAVIIGLVFIIWRKRK
jgi:hypothetical protein